MNDKHLRLRLEFLWWGFTAVLVVAVLLPIYLGTHRYPFYVANALYVIFAVTFARYTFFLKHTFLARLFWVKFLIIAGNAILLFVLTTSLGDFTTYMDEKGLQTLVDHLPVKRQYSLVGYIRGEMVFFGVASIVGAMFLAFRMLVSIWRQYNHGTV